MKRFIALTLAGSVLAGCHSAEPQADTPPVVAQPVVATVDKPVAVGPTMVGLIIGNKPVITVGAENPDKIFGQFRDTKQFGSEFNDLPPKFNYHFRARTWETAHTGFGLITYDGTLVGAMYQEDGVKQDQVDEIVGAHRSRMDDLAPVPVKGKRVSYWFWDHKGQRLMICAFQAGRQGIKLTAAMGDNAVMDALGMSIEEAKIDALKIDASGSQGPRTFAPVVRPTG